jgi:hypothetical protein
VSSERDRPQLPSDDELAELRKNPVVAGIIRT